MEIEKEYHIVTINNCLYKSPIQIKSLTGYCISGEEETHYNPAKIVPVTTRQFTLASHNNMSKLQILLPFCYEQRLVDIEINKKEETIYISAPTKKETEIFIKNTANKDLATIKALINPSKYHCAKQLVLEEMLYNQNQIEQHPHIITIKNLLSSDVDILHRISFHNPYGVRTATGVSKKIQSHTEQSLSILSENGKAHLEFLLPDCHIKNIELDLDENQKNIFIKQGDGAFNEIVITDESKQLAWTFTIIHEQ